MVFSKDIADEYTMKSQTEISALFTLIDDPDEEVFDAVSSKIIGYGTTILPELEDLWENTPEHLAQNRIEQLMHRLRFTELKNDFKNWNNGGHHDLVSASLLTGKFQYPELTSATVIHEIEKIRRNTWLELNNYLTPLEQVNVISNILYGYFSLTGCETNYTHPDQFLLHKTLQVKKGNQISNGILYVLLCEQLDIPVRAISLPRQFLLAYFKSGYSASHLFNYRSMIEFFIEPISGQVFTHDDVDQYLNRTINVPDDNFFKPHSNKTTIKHLIKEFSNCFVSEQETYKKEELLQLVSIIS